MDQISGWARLQDDMKASFKQATGVIRQLREGNERLRAERDLLREKIVRSADQQEETSALLKRTGVIVKKLMDENDMLRNERQRPVEESVDVLKMLLERIHRFLHQPFVLDAQHGILVHKFLDDDAGPLQQGSSLLLLLRTSDNLCHQQVTLGPELRIALI